MDAERQDANAAWSRRLREHHAAAGGDCARFWQDERVAAEYAALVEQCDWGAALMDAVADLDLAPNATVLDIGAGTGTHTIPLSCSVRSVTAVEPSPAMLSCLRSNLAARGITNVDCVAGRWEEVGWDVGIHGDLSDPFDLVIASFSLDMVDLRRALRRMQDVCRGHVFLIWHHGPQAWESVYLDLWPHLHGRPYVPEPKSDALLAVLAEMGVDPSVRIHSSVSERRFPSLERAVDHFAAELRVDGPAARRLLSDYLGARLRPRDHDLVFLDSGDFAVISWRAGDRSGPARRP